MAALAAAPGDRSLAGSDAPGEQQHHDRDHHLDVAELLSGDHRQGHRDAALEHDH